MYNFPFGHHRTNYRYKDTLFFVHPKYTSVDINKSGNEEQIRENPSGRVTEANGDVAECRHRQQADQNTGYHFGNARKHSQIGVARSLNRVAQDTKQPQYREERDRYMQEKFRISQYFHFRSLYKQQSERSGSEHQHHESERPVDNHHQSACLDTLPYTFGLARTVVLSAISGHRHTQALEGTHKEHLDTHGSRKSRYTRRTQRVVGALQHDTADSGDGKLQPHRHSDIHQRTRQRAVEFTFGRSSSQNFKTLHHIDVTQRRRNSLGKDRSDRRSRHTPVQNKDTKQVEQNIQDGGKKQKPKTAFCYPPKHV